MSPSSSIDASKVDAKLAVPELTMDGFDVHGLDDPALELFGFPWRRPGERCRRFPTDMDLDFNPGVNILSWCTAGGHLRFRSDAREIKVHAIVDGRRMPHMAMVGSHGFDLYVGNGMTQVFAMSTLMAVESDEYVASVYGSPNAIMRDFTLYFPLYAGVTFLELGLSGGSTLLPPTPWPDARPIVVYGTSITQGGCVSRPGMLYSNILSRLLRRPIYNFGFSGSGRGEEQVARKLAEIADPAMFILDYDDNARPELLGKTLEPFIRILRAAHPRTPILTLSSEPKSHEAFEPIDAEYASKERAVYTDIHADVTRRLRAEGDDNLYFLDGMRLYGDDFEECTVDGAHATDLGTYRIAHALRPVVERILNRWW